MTTTLPPAAASAALAELRDGLDAALTAAGWHRVLGDATDPDWHAMTALPEHTVWAHPTESDHLMPARIVLDAADGTLGAWRGRWLRWLTPHAAELTVLDAIARLRVARMPLDGAA